jgi:hypothetical protein
MERKQIVNSTGKKLNNHLLNFGEDVKAFYQK